MYLYLAQTQTYFLIARDLHRQSNKNPKWKLGKYILDQTTFDDGDIQKYLKKANNKLRLIDVMPLVKFN